MELYQFIASKLVAIQNCRKSGNEYWEDRHQTDIESALREHMPSGSGFDAGVEFDIEAHIGADVRRLVFDTAFHHMAESGMYWGWTYHKVIVTPSFAGFDMRVTGRDRNDIKNYIGEVFHDALRKAMP